MKRKAVGTALAACILAAGLLGGCGEGDVVSSYARAASIDYEGEAEAASSETVSAPDSVVDSADTSEASSVESVRDAYSQETAPEAGTHVMTASDGIGSISVPGEWENLNGQIEDTLESFTIKAGSPDDAMYLMFSSESGVNTPVPDLQAYFNTIVSGVTTNGQLSDVSAQTDTSLTLTNGYPAIRTTFTAVYTEENQADSGSSAGQIRLAYWIYAVQAGDYYCQFNCWTNADNAASAGETFDAIVNSLTI